MKRMRLSGLGWGAIAVVLLEAPAPALAQEAEEAPAAAVTQEADQVVLTEFDFTVAEDGETSIAVFAGAIDFSVNLIGSNAYDGRRLAIDVSGDGTSDRNDPAPARDRAILRGITINGLVIHSQEYDLGDLARFELRTHYRDRVIGGPGAFLLNAESFKTFAVSMREKLYREISGPLFAAGPEPLRH